MGVPLCAQRLIHYSADFAIYCHYAAQTPELLSQMYHEFGVSYLVSAAGDGIIVRGLADLGWDNLNVKEIIAQ
ncbi:MAG: hypothetical protein IT324_00550 [Anaerolineae bacterium]|nr:hypothetical protein [Anaerolineae bacterium]